MKQNPQLHKDIFKLREAFFSRIKKLCQEVEEEIETLAKKQT